MRYKITNATMQNLREPYRIKRHSNKKTGYKYALYICTMDLWSRFSNCRFIGIQFHLKLPAL